MSELAQRRLLSPQRLHNRLQDWEHELASGDLI